MLKEILICAGGGAIGAALRYSAGQAAFELNKIVPSLANFPVATLCVNLIGCFVIGFLSHFVEMSAHPLKQEFKVFAITGVLGGFTTFSSFSLESISLIDQAKYHEAALYIGISLIGGLLVAFLGRALAMQIWK